MTPPLLPPEDLAITVRRHAGGPAVPGSPAVTVCHLPSGRCVTVAETESEARNRALALRRLALTLTEPPAP